MCMFAGVAVLEAIEEDQLQQHAHEVGTYLIQQLQTLQKVSLQHLLSRPPEKELQLKTHDAAKEVPLMHPDQEVTRPGVRPSLFRHDDRHLLSAICCQTAQHKILTIVSNVPCYTGLLDQQLVLMPSVVSHDAAMNYVCLV